MDILIDRSSSSTWKAILWSLGSDRVTRWDLRFGWRLSPISWLCRRRVWRICTKSKTPIWWQDFQWSNSDPRSTSWYTYWSLPMRLVRQYCQRRRVVRQFQFYTRSWELDCTWRWGCALLWYPILTWNNLSLDHLHLASKQWMSWWLWCSSYSWCHRFHLPHRRLAWPWLRMLDTFMDQTNVQGIAEIELAHCCSRSPFQILYKIPRSSILELPIWSDWKPWIKQRFWIIWNPHGKLYDCSYHQFC